MIPNPKSMPRSSMLHKFRQYLTRRRIRQRRRTLDAELPVTAYLDWLRVKSYRIYDGIPGDSGNFDHVIICTQGIFLVSKMTRSRPSEGDCVVEFNGAGISIDDSPFDIAPVNAVIAQAEQLERLLKEHTERNFAVRPVLLFPGWHIRDSEAPKTSGVWVLNPRSLGKWIDFRPASLHPELVELSCQGLDRYLKQFA